MQVLVEHPEAFVKHIKQCLSSKEGIPVKQQRLVFSGPGAQALEESQETSKQQPAVEEILSSLSQWQVGQSLHLLSQQVLKAHAWQHCMMLLSQPNFVLLHDASACIVFSAGSCKRTLTLLSCAMSSALDRCKAAVHCMDSLSHHLAMLLRCLKVSSWLCLSVGI